MDAYTLQARLDSIGEIVLPAGEYLPTVPMFLDKECHVRGYDCRSVLRADVSCSAFVFGVERGRFPQSRYRPDGISTGVGNDHFHLWTPDGDWVTGPQSSLSGWLGVRKLRIAFSATLLDGADWGSSGLCGIQTATGVASPMPWCLYTESGNVVLALRTIGGGIHKYAVTHPGTPRLEFIWEVDFTLGSASCNLGTVTAATAPIAPNSYLYSNLNHGFSIGSLRPHAGARGYFGGTDRDMVIHYLNVRYNDNAATACYTDTIAPRLLSSDPAKSLPLVRQMPGGFFYAVPVAQSGWRAENIMVSGVRIQGRNGSPAMIQGWVEGGLTIRDVHCQGGSRSYTSFGGNVGYPVKMQDCIFIGPSDCCVYAVRNTVGSVIRDTQFKYGRRCSVHALGCEYLLENIMDAPPGTAPDACMIFEGGQNAVRIYKGDMEYIIPPEFVAIKARPAGFDTDFVTTLDAEGVSFRAPQTLIPDSQLFRPLAAQEGYTAAFVVKVNGNVLA